MPSTTAEHATVTEAAAISRYAAGVRLLARPDSLNCTLSPGYTCLLTDDGAPLTTAVAQRLQAKGWKVVLLQFPHTLIHPQSEPVPTIPHIMLHDLCEQHLNETFNHITTSYGPVGAFIHLHPLCTGSAYDDGILFSEREKLIVRHIFLMAKYLKHTLGVAAYPGRSWFVTVAHLDGQLGLGETTSAGVIGGGLFALTKTIKLEWEQVFCRALDIHPDIPTAQAVAHLEAELHDPNQLLIEVGYSSRGRVTLIGKERGKDGLPVAANRAADTDINGSSVFVVSGGARGITARCVVRMAQQYGCTFLLLGRTPYLETEPAWAHGYTREADLKRRYIESCRAANGHEPTPGEIETSVKAVAASREIATTLHQIAHAGGHAEYLCVDVADHTALQRSLPTALQRVGAVTGLLHGAGVLADKLIEQKTAADFEKVYAPKVAGLQNLLDCLPPFQLDYILLFSSVAGFYGNVGQADYAIANEVLNKAAHALQRAYPNCRVISFNWGPWDRGMVSPGLKHLFEQHNIATIAADAGAQMLVDELRTNDHDVQVLVGSPISSTTQERLDILLRMLRSRRAIMGNPHTETSSDLHTYHIRRTLSLRENPFVTDHVIGSNPVLPATCVMAWIAATGEQLYPGYTFFRCEQYHVMHGIFVDDTPRDYTLELKEVTKEQETGVIVLDSLIWSEPQTGRLCHHYKGRLTLQRHIPAPPRCDIPASADTCTIPGSVIYQDGTLFHGRSFQGAVSIHHMSDDHLMMRCLLPALAEHVQGQFAVQMFNPYTADVCGQSALILAQRQFARRSLPTGVGSFEQFKPIPFDTPYYVSLTVCSRTTRKLVVNLSVYDTEGQVLTRFGDVEFMLMPMHPHVLWDKAAIREFASGKISNVFGKAYAPIDTLPRRVRLPLHPYLFMDRVTSLVAERGEFKPCSIVTEYDIPDDVLYSIDGTIPWSVAVEAGQGILFLLGYLGIDTQFQGQRVYRHLDFGVVFLDHLPRTGQTLQYHIHVRSFVRRRTGMLLFYQFDCFADGKAVMRMEQSCAGFFTDEELDQGRGIIDVSKALPASATPDRAEPFVPPLTCQKRRFDQHDLHSLSAGDLALCFGDAYNHHGANPSLRLPPPAMLMVDRVCMVDPSGGTMHRGVIIAEKKITPDDWYFQCHFKDDPVLPGSLLIDGCAQLVQFYLLFLGMQTRTSNAHFQPMPGIEQRARFRAQIYPTHALVMYHMDVIEVGMMPQPYVRATVRLSFENKVAAILNIGVQLADHGN